MGSPDAIFGVAFIMSSATLSVHCKDLLCSHVSMIMQCSWLCLASFGAKLYVTKSGYMP